MKNPLNDYPGYHLRRAASSRLGELARHLEGFNLGVTEASILTVIDQNPDMSQAECGRMLSIKRPNLNPLMLRLIHRGLVSSTKGEGRALKLRLTEEGKALIPGILAEFEAQEARIFASVPEKFRADLVTILRALRVKE